MPKKSDRLAMDRIASSLADCGLDLGDVSKCQDLDRFADWCEVAARNKGLLPPKKKPKPKVRMSLRSRGWKGGRMTEDEVVRSFLMHANGEQEDATVAAFLSHIGNDN